MATSGTPADRWIEVDLDWFGEFPREGALELFAERCAPLLRGVSGRRGVILNAGWLADVVTEWDGRAEQQLPFRSRRYANWHGQSYRHLADFVCALREAFDRHGVNDIAVGIFIAALGHVLWPPESATLYDLRSSWSERHPELYPLDVSLLPGPDLDPRVPLRADDYAYASRPSGVAEGLSFAELLAGQWASLAKFCGLDAIHLRDGFWGPLLYSRRGPYGTTASPDPAENASWTAAVIDLVRQLKLARPEAVVMAYSSGVSATAEWRVGCVDLHAVVADGHLDVWIDQTWGGAWQDWWDQHWKGWSFQLANLLGHAALLRGANERRSSGDCRHYALIETWDGWEPWDTIHRTPAKLEWGIWAFLHAAVVDDEKIYVPDGTYISWMSNAAGDLLSGEDIDFLATTIADAETSARELERVMGPRMIVDRHGVGELHIRSPEQNGSEWIEDQVGMLLKWGTPILSSSLAGNAGEVDLGLSADGAVHQLASFLPATGGGTFVAAGRLDLMPVVVDALGIVLDPALLPDGYVLDESTPRESVHLPVHARVVDEGNSEVRYRAGGDAVLLGRDDVWLWQPPDLHAPGNALFPRNQYGSVEPYRAVARLLSESSHGVRVALPPAHAPVTVSVWRSAGGTHLLLGNLDTGWIGDSRWPREVEVLIPVHLVGSSAPEVASLGYHVPAEHPRIRVDHQQQTISIIAIIPASGLAHFILSPKESPS